MKISVDHHNNISVTPHDDRKIIRQFTDAETGLLVVFEVEKPPSKSPTIYYTLIDTTHGTIIEPSVRAQQIDTTEHTLLEPQLQLKITTQRTIDQATGLERILEQIIDLSTGQTLTSRRSVAFSPTKRETLLATYLKRLSEQPKEGSPMFDPHASLSDRQGAWLAYLYRDMRMMGEIGQDEYSIFTKANYRDWKAREPEIDQILEYVYEHLPRMWPGQEDAIRHKIRDMRR
jgi:hypothetical protein